ncbi:MAG: hypothetical protein K0Q59_2376 [Paenibacillus sp.]|nr:hypothetical protein [Paenibacillus sp.]
MWKKIAAPVLLGGALVAGAFAAHAEPARFSDQSGHWAADSIAQAVQKGYVDGYEDGTFRPDLKVTRAEFAKMVVTALKLPVGGNTGGADWYIPFANAAVNGGIHRWSDFNYGDWNTPITRQEMARMIVRATNKELKKPDANKADSELMYLAAKAGLIQGLQGGELGVNEATTRAQSVTVIERVLAVNGGGTLEADKYAVNRAELAWHKTNIFTVMPEFFSNLNPRYPWNIDNLFVETPDGDYRGELDALIAIDLDDPNDPNLYLLGALSTLEWNNTVLQKGQLVSKLKNNYVLYFQGHEVYNNNKELYRSRGHVPYTLTGFIHNEGDFKNGEMSSIARVYQKNNEEIPAFLISKNAKVDGGFYVQLYAPVIAGNMPYYKTLLISLIE